MAWEAAVVAATESPVPHKTLAALTGAALALPGMPPAQAALPGERQWDLGYFYYDENGDRMTVESLRQTLVLPFEDSVEVTFNGVRDNISGASPIYNLPEFHCADGSVVTPPVRSVSGASGEAAGNGGGGPPPDRPALAQCPVATARPVLLEDGFKDVRTAGDLRLSRYWDDAILGLGAGVSQEKDYDSQFLNLDLRWDFNAGQTTLAAGYSLASDTFSPLNDPGFTGDKQTHQFLLGLTQVITRETLAQVNLTYEHNRGFLTDPYKNVYVLETSEAVAEQRPDRRRKWNLLARLVRHVPAWDAALHLDYRYSRDDWGLDAHLLEAAWIQPLDHGWELVPRLRYYSQAEADFYRSYFETLPEDGEYSSDYRLAGFGALGGSLKLTRQFGEPLRISAGVEWYRRKSRYALGAHQDNAFADYDFAIYRLSLNLQF